MPSPRKTNPPGVHDAQPYIEEESAAGSAQEAWSARSQLLEEIDVDAPLPDGNAPRPLPTPNPIAQSEEEQAATLEKRGLGFLPPTMRRPRPTPMPQGADDPAAPAASDGRKLENGPSFSGLLLLSGQPGVQDEVLVLDDDIPTAALPSSGGPSPARKAAGAKKKKGWRWTRKIVVFWHRGPASIIWRHPTISICTALLLVVALGILTIVFEPSPAILGDPADPPRDVYYYDVETSAVFTHNSADLPPVTTPWPSAAMTPHGYRAYVFSCGECVPQSWEVLYIESYSPAIKEAWERYHSPGNPAEMPNPMQGRFVADPLAQQWKPLSDPEAKELLMRPYMKCPDGRAARQCMPEPIKSPTR